MRRHSCRRCAGVFVFAVVAIVIVTLVARRRAGVVALVVVVHCCRHRRRRRRPSGTGVREEGGVLSKLKGGISYQLS